MNTIVIEHVHVGDLPEAWRARLPTSEAWVTVRIEEEPAQPADLINDPLFGMWRDRDDMEDVAAYVRQLRAPRFTREGRTDAD